jgi:hypothetical protein
LIASDPKAWKDLLPQDNPPLGREITRPFPNCLDAH